jgi:hypothetical protein
VALGVAGTLSDTARRALDRSAEQAGFYEAGRDRLVLPGFVPDGAPFEVPGEGNGNGSGPGTGGGGGGGVRSRLALIPC